MLFVHVGSCVVDVGGETRELRTGQLVLVPAGVRHEVRTRPGTVVVPLTIPAGELPPALARVTVREDRADWRDWVVSRFAQQVSPLSHLPWGSGRERTVPAGVSIPRTAAGRDVALALVRDPGRTDSVEQLSASVGVSARTLRRIFAAEVGMSVAGWRLGCRLAVAREHLRAGESVASTARRVGFATTTGFIRAFARTEGRTPGEWLAGTGTAAGGGSVEAAQDADGVRSAVGADSARGAGTAVGTRSTGGSGVVGPRVANEPRAADGPLAWWSELLTGDGPPPGVPASLAERRTYPHVTVWLWMYRGSARVRVGDRTQNLARGDAVRMTAGLEHEVHLREGAIALPFSYREDRPTSSPALAHTPPGDEDGYFREHAHADDARGTPAHGPAGEIARRVAADPGDVRGLREWAEELGVTPAQIDRDFRAQVGCGFASWRSSMRAQAARDLMAGGLDPSVAARRVGYRHLSAFSRAFRRRHGFSPREYLESSRAG
ncbi:Transcriptional regulator, AraC family [Actinomycetales bacterium JB111]|nr:Transcriptional regulator, AraC family [Actinomycetales bacterium JB111]